MANVEAEQAKKFLVPLATPELRQERVAFYASQIRELPPETLTHMQCFSLAMGCPEVCAMCSVGAPSHMTRMLPDAAEDLIAGIAIVAGERNPQEPYVAMQRTFKPGHILLFNDDDPALHPNAASVIERIATLLHVPVSISTVGYSRRNHELQRMHETVAAHPDWIREFRISLSTYPRFMKKDPAEFSEDLANLFRTYLPLLNHRGIGRDGMRVEIHTQPLTQINSKKIDLDDTTILRHHIVRSGPYMLISQEERHLEEKSTIIDYKPGQDTHPIFDDRSQEYTLLVSDVYVNDGDWEQLARYVINSMEDGNFKIPAEYNEAIHMRSGKLHLFTNEDGLFYAFDPSFKDNGLFQALNFYPLTSSRPQSGVLNTERFIMNAIITHKRKRGISFDEPFDNATWDDVEETIKDIRRLAAGSTQYNRKQAEFLRREILVIMEVYTRALKQAEYPPALFFSPKFTIDTGVIGNAGRALTLFGGLVSQYDSPVDINDIGTEELYKRRDLSWRWTPKPYVSDGFSSGISLSGLKNTLGGKGQVAVSAIDRKTFSSIPEQTYIIYGVPMEQVAFHDTVSSGILPGWKPKVS